MTVFERQKQRTRENVHNVHVCTNWLLVICELLLCSSFSAHLPSPTSLLLAVISAVAPHTVWHLQLKVCVSWEAACPSAEPTRRWQAGSETPLPRRGTPQVGTERTVRAPRLSRNYPLPPRRPLRAPQNVSLPPWGSQNASEAWLVYSAVLQLMEPVCGGGLISLYSCGVCVCVCVCRRCAYGNAKCMHVHNCILVSHYRDTHTHTHSMNTTGKLQFEDTSLLYYWHFNTSSCQVIILLRIP